MADSADRAALEALVGQASVVITTVGPYLQHGGPLVAACVKAGTHYVDLTGEAPFVKESIEQHHTEAQKKRVKIVHCCGEFFSKNSQRLQFNLFCFPPVLAFPHFKFQMQALTPFQAISGLWWRSTR